MSKQSSIEWYIENRKKLEYDYDTKGIGILKFIERKKEIEKQAKAIHKEEILIAHSKALPITDGVFTAIDKAHEYYNETFGGNNEN